MNGMDYEDLNTTDALTCKERVSKLIIDPKNYYRASWTIMIGFVYSICYIIDPLLISF